MAPIAKASPERAAEVLESLADIRARIRSADKNAAALVAVSKRKPSSDILACYEGGQLDFGENYVQELVEKAAELPKEIRWHFIGTLQSNKAKTLAAIPNLHTIQTLTSLKAATDLNQALPPSRTTPLNVLIQVNTSGESSKSGHPPLVASSPPETLAGSGVTLLSMHIIKSCPGLRFQGLMTIGSLEQSLDANRNGSEDFEKLKETRDVLHSLLDEDEDARGKWGVDGRLVLSMGMSSDFEAALEAGSDIIRVGTGIFGERQKSKT